MVNNNKPHQIDQPYEYIQTKPIVKVTTDFILLFRVPYIIFYILVIWASTQCIKNISQHGIRAGHQNNTITITNCHGSQIWQLALIPCRVIYLMNCIEAPNRPIHRVQAM